MHAVCNARNIGVVNEGFHAKVLFSAKVGILNFHYHICHGFFDQLLPSPSVRVILFFWAWCVQVGEKVEHNTDTVHGSNDREGISEKSSAPGAAIMTRESKDSKAITKSSGHDQNPIKPLVSVSWYAPHKNHRQNAGFHSDYAMPRTRTPSHN